MVEVELKVRVSSFEKTAQRLRELAGTGKDYVKADLYFSPPGCPADSPVTAFRLRNENGEWIVTSKKKIIEEGIEVSTEREFTVSSPEDFRNFAQDLGYGIFLEKRKTGTCYSWGSIKAELSHVDHLGDYLELEILVPDGASPRTISQARTDLLSALGVLGFSPRDVEGRPYTQMLREKRN